MKMFQGRNQEVEDEVRLRLALATIVINAKDEGRLGLALARM
jgi:hypothetical protein